MDWIPPRRSTAETLRSVAHRTVTGIRRLAFWSAVALPVLYLPPLIAGPDSTAQFAVVVALLAVHVVAILVGHEYRRAAREEELAG